MISSKEKKQLQKILAKAVDQDEVFTFEELLGFLYGLAVTPDMILPSEWLPVVFGEGMIEVDTEKEGQALLSALLGKVNELTGRFQNGMLRFPFDLEYLENPDELLTIQDWTFGFHEALLLRPEIWFTDSDPDSLSEEQEDLEASLAVILGIVEPDEIEEIFEVPHFFDEDEEMRMLASLYAMLPLAIETIQHHAYGLEQERLQRHKNRPSGPPHINLPPKIGRNEPCPCGSGKKYKKCCLQAKVVPLRRP